MKIVGNSQLNSSFIYMMIGYGDLSRTQADVILCCLCKVSWLSYVIVGEENPTCIARQIT